MTRLPFRRSRDTLRLERGNRRMSRQAESDQPNAKDKALKPSAEVAEKMHPVSRGAFFDLLRRAVTPPVRKPAAKHR